MSCRQEFHVERRTLLAAGGAAATGMLVGDGVSAAVAPSTPGTGRPAARVPAGRGVSLRQVQFRTSDGVWLAGHLRVPNGRRRPTPAIVLANPVTAVKDQSVVVNYARGLAEAGFVTLAFDQRGYGESGGQPRLLESHPQRRDDLRTAVSYLTTLREDVDPERIGAFGQSIGGGLVLELAAIDPRVRAFVSVGAYFTSPQRFRQLLGEEAFATVLNETTAALQQYHLTGDPGYLPFVSPTGEGALAPDPEAWQYYGTGRGTSSYWENRISILTNRFSLEADLMSPADMVGQRAGLIVVGSEDVGTPPSLSRAAYDRLTGPRELFVVDGAIHIDLYDNQTYVPRVIDAAAEWLRQHLD